MEKHYTLLKTAQLLGVTTQTLRNWDNAKKIRTVRTVGNQRRVPESEIVRLLGSAVPEVAEVKHKPQRTTAVVVETKDNMLLMCKDAAVYDITENRVLNGDLLPGSMLKKTKTYSDWMKTRFCRETNFSAGRLMQRAFGTFDHEKAVAETRALSLSDCYWLKKQNENVLFDDVTPYVHKEWDGTSQYKTGSLSTLFTGGTSDKYWQSSKALLKVNSFNEYEPYVLCSALGIENIADIQMSDEGILVTNFTSTSCFLETMEQSGETGESDNLYEKAALLFKEQAVALFVVDYFVENKNRHSRNYGFLRDTNTGEYISMAPYYGFKRIWSGDVTPIPESVLQEYRGYINNLCRWAISAAGGFEYGTIIERRARELLRI